MKNLVTYLFAAAMLLSVSGYANDPVVEDSLKGAEEGVTDAVETGNKEAKKATKKAKKSWRKKVKEMKVPTDEAGTDSAPAPGN